MPQIRRKVRKRFLLIALSFAMLAYSASCGGDDTPSARPIPQPTDVVGTPSAGKVPVGLFLEPRRSRITQVSLPAKPASPFQAPEGRNLVLYDLQTGKQTNLGESVAMPPAFSGDRMLLSQGGEVWLVDLKTMERTSLGQGVAAFFLDADNVAIFTGGSRTLHLNLTTGQRFLAGALAQFPIVTQGNGYLGGPLVRTVVEGGYHVRLALDVEKEFRFSCQDKPEAERGVCGARLMEEYAVEPPGENAPLLQFRALQATPAGPGEIVVATSPVCDDGGKQVWCEEVLAKLGAAAPNETRWAKGTTNIFIVDIAKGVARFVATARYEPSTRIRPFNWPLAADANYVVWTESYCNPNSQGKTRVYDRKNNVIKELDASLWVQLRAGLIGAGEFGAQQLIDPATLQYRAALPSGVTNAIWSDDYRYAAVGGPTGHGGLCG